MPPSVQLELVMIEGTVFENADAANFASTPFGSSKGCVETKGLYLAPQVGLEPTTLRLTAEPLVAASCCKYETYEYKKPIVALIGGTLGGQAETSS